MDKLKSKELFRLYNVPTPPYYCVDVEACGENLEKLITMMRGPAGTKVKVTIRRQNVAEPLHFELTREEIHVKSVSSQRLDNDVGYVRLKQFQEGTHDELIRRDGDYATLERTFRRQAESASG